jgi:hypothetical protein
MVYTYTRTIPRGGIGHYPIDFEELMMLIEKEGSIEGD